MLPMLTDYLERLETLHAGVEQALEGLPPAALDWVPGPDMNSLTVLAVHIAGSQRFWIGELVGRDPSGRKRPAEFRASGLGLTTLQTTLAQVLTNSRSTLVQVTLEMMEDTRVSPFDQREVTVAWCLAHALEHTALHLGQMQITRQMWQLQQAGQES